jgi:hypothetical protein
MIENVREALDTENEFFFDAKERRLYVRPNATDASGKPAGQYAHRGPNLSLLDQEVDTSHLAAGTWRWRSRRSSR